MNPETTPAGQPAGSFPAGSICILPRLRGMGGPSSFQGRLIAGLNRRGYRVHNNPLDSTCRAVLVVGAVSRFDLLLRARRRGLRIVQRLNGMNWIHRKRPTPPGYYLRSEYNNFILSFTRKNLADRIVYQSQFACKWWQTVHGSTPADSRVVYNGVDLDTFQPDPRSDAKHDDLIRILMVEAHISGGYEQGLANAVELARLLREKVGSPVELVVAGQVDPRVQAAIERGTPDLVRFAGVVPLAEIPALDRSAHMLFSADLNAACPNSVIEALACGLPVLAFATGSLPELITRDTGRVVPYGSNYWNLEPPDVPSLANAALEVLSDLPAFRRNARRRAEEEFGVDRMVDNYLDALIG